MNIGFFMIPLGSWKFKDRVFSTGLHHPVARPRRVFSHVNSWANYSESGMIIVAKAYRASDTRTTSLKWPWKRSACPSFSNWFNAWMLFALSSSSIMNLWCVYYALNHRLLVGSKESFMEWSLYYFEVKGTFFFRNLVMEMYLWSRAMCYWKNKNTWLMRESLPVGRCYNQNPRVTHWWSLVFQYCMQHTEFILQ